MLDGEHTRRSGILLAIEGARRAGVGLHEAIQCRYDAQSSLRAVRAELEPAALSDDKVQGRYPFRIVIWKYSVGPTPSVKRSGSNLRGFTYQHCDTGNAAQAAAKATACSLEPVRPTSNS